ncbi:unnamed protein product, partial [Discosporangium mesarthrocarpum]
GDGAGFRGRRRGGRHPADIFTNGCGPMLTGEAHRELREGGRHRDGAVCALESGHPRSQGLDPPWGSVGAQRQEQRRRQQDPGHAGKLASPRCAGQGCRPGAVPRRHGCGRQWQRQQRRQHCPCLRGTWGGPGWDRGGAGLGRGPGIVRPGQGAPGAKGGGCGGGSNGPGAGA